LSTGFGEINRDFEQIDSSDDLYSVVTLYSDDPIVTVYSELYSEVFLNDIK
jgi:hypothetical protein